MMDWLDERLGRITMYRLVLFSLLVLAAVALVLMFAGTIEIVPWQYLVSVAVLGSVSYGSNRLFGWLFSIRPHSESAWITGLILSFLFVPPDDALGFAKLALVAVIAMASKYVIAPRGRHVFNPAAIAVVIASVGGLAYAGWWVATPAMIPATLVAGFLIMRRTKKQFVSLLFVVVAAVSLFVQGTDPVTTLVSWPLLFVGAIMLTEPLTLPPRLAQQYAVAATVGLLMTLPLQYGRLTMTPALALVIGNAVAWWFGQRRAVKLRFVGKKQMGETAYDFTFDTNGLTFEPGQYAEVTLVHENADSRGHRRVFSIVGSPGDDQISFGTRIPTRPSSFKRVLMNMKPGTTLHATRIAGDFVLPADKDVPVVCIAGGIGITPFVSYAMSSNRPLTIIYAVANTDDIAFAQQLAHHAADVTVVSPDDGVLPDSDWKYVKGRLDADVLGGLIDVSTNPTVYVSGAPAMVAATRKIVKAMGVKNVKVDEFSGY